MYDFLRPEMWALVMIVFKKFFRLLRPNSSLRYEWFLIYIYMKKFLFDRVINTGVVKYKPFLC